MKKLGRTERKGREGKGREGRKEGRKEGTNERWQADSKSNC